MAAKLRDKERAQNQQMMNATKAISKASKTMEDRSGITSSNTDLSKAKQNLPGKPIDSSVDISEAMTPMGVKKKKSY